jgi:hypothetical protein
MSIRSIRMPTWRSPGSIPATGRLAKARPSSRLSTRSICPMSCAMRMHRPGGPSGEAFFTDPDAHTRVPVSDDSTSQRASQKLRHQTKLLRSNGQGAYCQDVSGESNPLETGSCVSCRSPPGQYWQGQRTLLPKDKRRHFINQHFWGCARVAGRLWFMCMVRQKELVTL